jgi:hypothetical protein
LVADPNVLQTDKNVGFYFLDNLGDSGDTEPISAVDRGGRVDLKWVIVRISCSVDTNNGNFVLFGEMV